MKKKSIRKFLMSTVICTMMFAVGCNKQMIDFNLKFNKAYIKVGDEWRDVEIKTWTDYEDGEQIQIKLKDGTVLIVHSANCILYNGTLPMED